MALSQPGAEPRPIPLAASHRRGGRRRRWPIVAAALFGLLVVVLGAAWFASPGIGDPEALVRSRVAAAGGRLVPLSDISRTLREAVVATEDERFWRHHGLDLIGVFRAAAYDVSHLSFSQGGSTITEQLAKELYLSGNDHSPWRKLEDAAVAVKLESRLSKDGILDAYLNTVYFGDRAYGIGAASRRYFGVAPNRLSLSEASLLAGLVQAPSEDDPFAHPSAARSRQADVLRSMIRNDYITPAEGQRVMAAPLRLAGGRVVPAEPGVSLTLPPAYSTPLMVVGVLLFAAGTVALVVFRKRTRALAWRLAPGAAVIVGLLLAARALHGD